MGAGRTAGVGRSGGHRVRAGARAGGRSPPARARWPPSSQPSETTRAPGALALTPGRPVPMVRPPTIPRQVHPPRAGRGAGPAALRPPTGDHVMIGRAVSSRLRPGLVAVGALAALLAALAGCKGQQTRGQAEDEADKEHKYEVKTVGDYTTVAGADPLPVGGVGLVTGLAGTGGGAPPGSYRTFLEHELQRRNAPTSRNCCPRPTCPWCWFPPRSRPAPTRATRSTWRSPSRPTARRPACTAAGWRSASCTTTSP